MTVRQLAGRRGLGLTIVAGAAGADRVVSWAHPIELLDPTRWLSGGELVMTTGLTLPTDADGLRAYVTRLSDAGVAALAIDTGTTLSEIPAAIVEAADQLDFAVLRVPKRTPFIAVSRAVIDDLAADQVRTVTQVVDNQERLARAAARGGLVALVETLSGQLDATVTVVDRSGGLLAHAGPIADLPARLTARLTAENGRITGSRALADDDAVITINPLPPSGDPHGYLGVAADAALDTAGRLLVGHAVSLLSLEMSKPTGILDAELRLRIAALALLRSGGTLDHRLARQLGFPHDAEVSALFVAAENCASVIRRTLDESGTAYLVEPLDNGVALVISSDAVVRVGPFLAAACRRATGRRTPVGVGRSGPLSTVRDGLGQAQAAARANRSDDAVRHIDAVSTLALLLGGDPDSAKALIDSSGLSAVHEHDRVHGTSLFDTLRAYLTYSGQWDTSASAVGVHRHTMRNRMRKIAEVTGRDVDDPQHRAELWLAMQADELR